MLGCGFAFLARVHCFCCFCCCCTIWKHSPGTEILKTLALLAATQQCWRRQLAETSVVPNMPGPLRVCSVDSKSSTHCDPLGWHHWSQLLFQSAAAAPCGTNRLQPLANSSPLPVVLSPSWHSWAALPTVSFCNAYCVVKGARREHEERIKHMKLLT